MATLDIVIRAQNQASAALNQLKGQLNGINREAGFAQRGMGGLQNAVGSGLVLAAGAGVAAIGGITAGLVAGVGEFASFQKGMQEVFTLLPGLSETAMREMEGDVKSFATEFKTLPETVVPALYQAISAGVPADNVFSFLETAQKAAVGGVTDLTTAVDGISSVVNAYGAEVLSSARASDVMFTAVRLGKTNFEQLSSSLFNVIPAAAAMGISFEDVSAGLARLTAQGTPTSVATTQLRQLFVEAAKDTSTLGKAINEVAGESFTSLIAKGLSSAEILQMVRASMPDDEFRNLFGSVEAAGAALGITGPQYEAFVGTLDEMKDSVGATDAAFETMDRGLSRIGDQLKSFGQTALIEIGARAAPLLERLGKTIGDSLPGAMVVFTGALDRAASVLDRFLMLIDVGIDDGWNWVDWVGTLAIQLGMAKDYVDIMDSSLRNMSTAIVSMIAPFLSWNDVLIALGVVVASIVLPALGAMVAAAAPVIAVFAVIVGAVALLRNAWERDWGGIQGITENVVNGVVELVNGLWIAISTGDTQPLFDTLNAMWTSLTGWIATQAETLPGKMATWAVAFSTWAGEVWSDVSFYLDVFRNNLGSWITFQGAILGMKIERWKTQFTAWAGEVWADLSTNLGTMWTSLTAWIDSKVDVLYSYLYKWAIEFSTWAGEVWTELGPALNTMWNSLQNWVTLKGVELKNKIAEWGDSFLEFPEGMETALATVQAIWDAVTPVIENHVQRFKDAFGSLGESLGPLQDAFGRLFAALQPWFVGLGVTVGVAFLAIGAAISALLVFISSLVAEIGVIFTALINALATQVEIINSVFKGLFDLVTALVAGDWATAWEAAKTILWGFVATAINFGVTLWAVMTSMFNVIKNTVVGIFNDMGVDLVTEVTAIVSAVVLGWQEITSKVVTEVTAIASAVGMGWLRIRLKIQTEISAISSAVLIGWALISLRVSSILSEIVASVTGKFNELKAGAATAIDGLRATVEEKFNGIKTWIGGLSIPNPFAEVVAAATAAVNAIGNAWNSITGSGGGRGGGGGSGGAYAAGTDFFRGGMATINERGTELIALPGRNRQTWLPRGTTIYPAEQTPMMMGGGGGVTVNVYATVTNGMDAESLAHQIAGILRRNQR